VGEAGAVGADPQSPGVILEHGEDVVVGQPLAPRDRLERHVAELVEAAVPGRDPDAAFAVLEERGDDQALRIGVAGGRPGHHPIADEPGDAGRRADPQAAAAVEGERGDVGRGQAVRHREEPVRLRAAGPAQAVPQPLPQRAVGGADRRLDVLRALFVDLEGVVLEAKERPAGAESQPAGGVLVDGRDHVAGPGHQDQRLLVDTADRIAAGDPDRAALILVEGADLSGQPHLAELLEDAVPAAQHGSVVRADPEQVGVVDEERGDVVGLQHRRAVAVEGLELDAVEAHQPGLGAEPQEPLGILSQRPEAVGRQAVAGLPALQVVLRERLLFGRRSYLSGSRSSRQPQRGSESGNEAQDSTESGRSRVVHG
jgi:hypothetical protein